MAAPLEAPLPGDLDLGPGFTLRVTALSTADGSVVPGVTVSNFGILTESLATSGTPPPPPPPPPVPQPPPPVVSETVMDAFKRFLSDLAASTVYKDWCAAHAADCAAWRTYSQAIVSGGDPATPTMGSAFGKTLVDVGLIVLIAEGKTPPPPPVPQPPPPPPPPPSGTYLFQDEFTGPAGAPPDPARWNVKNGPAPFGDPAIPDNVFLDGNGHLVVRTARKAGAGYTGGFLATFNYGSGWPPTGVKASLPVPFRIEMRALMPDTAGAHSSLWMMNVDRSTSQDNYELDIAEERTTLDTIFGSHQHTWRNGSDSRPVDGQLHISSMRTNWHVYRGDVYSDHVTTYCDGVRAATFYGVSGHFGIILSNGIAPAGTWGAASSEAQRLGIASQPAAGDPGPWDMLVDYVRVSPL